MIRRLGALATVVAAVLAMSAMVASAASADVLTAESVPTTITGNGDSSTHTMGFDIGQFKCSGASYHGAVSASPSSQVTLTPVYTSCTLAGLAPVISLNGCDYLLHINAASTEGTTDITCSAGQEITLSAPAVALRKCIIHIPPQTGLGPITVSNIGTGTTREITLNMNISGLKYSQTTGTSEVGNCATADGTTNGTYTGKAVLTGEKSSTGVHIGIFAS